MLAVANTGGAMNTKIALVGNPNSGKTTLFNSITGLSQTVGNWTGVTIEKKSGKYLKNKSVSIIDLPGIYSMTSYTLEEKITRNYIINDKPDVVINVVDATNLERNLYLTTQLIECGVKMVIALNMEDELKRNGITIDSNKISEYLGVPVVSISALKGKNIDQLMKEAINTNDNNGLIKPIFNKAIEQTIEEVSKVSQSKNKFYNIKLFEKDPIYIKELDVIKRDKINDIIDNVEKELGETSVEIISNDRYNYIESIIGDLQIKTKSKSQLITDNIDRIVTNKYLAFPIFAAIIFLMYYVSISWLGDLTIGWMEGAIIERFGGFMEEVLLGFNSPEWLVSLLIDGIIAGVGMVLTFVPQILILFLFISVLEGCGYMARVAYIMDKLFKRIGLSGKSFIPMIIGCGCSVPAIMSTRTIEGNDERRMTILLTPFIPCAAKLPVFALFAAAFFPSNPFAAPSMYLLGILMVIISGLLLKKLRIMKSDADSFILELPQYRVPKVKNVMLQLWEKGKSFIIKAGTIIFVASLILWFLQSFSWNMQMSEPDDSMLADIGRVFAPLFVPLGFGNWQSAVSIFTGFFAKEAVVSTLSILTGVGENEAITPEFAVQLQAIFTPLSAYSFMAFVLLSAPCLAAIGAMKRELGSFKWMFIAVGFQTLMAYTLALVIYQTGSLFANNKGLFVTIVSIAIILIMTILSIISMSKRKGKSCGGGCTNCIASGSCAEAEKL